MPHSRTPRPRSLHATVHTTVHATVHHPYALGILPLIMVLMLLSGSGCRRTSAPLQRTDTVQAAQLPGTPRIVMEVARTSRLYTAEYQIHKVVTHSDAPTLEGQVLGMPVKVATRVGDRKVAIPITVTLKAYIDFSTFSAAQVERGADSSIVITLPDPQVVATASRVDHNGTRQYIDLTRSRYSDAELADFARQGADSIMSHAGRLGIAAQARRNAAQILVPMLRRMGFDERRITIRFRKDYTDHELLQNIHPA